MVVKINFQFQLNLTVAYMYEQWTNQNHFHCLHFTSDWILQHFLSTVCILQCMPRHPEKRKALRHEVYREWNCSLPGRDKVVSLKQRDRDWENKWDISLLFTQERWIHEFWKFVSLCPRMCPTSTGNYQIHKFDWLKWILIMI